MRRTRGPKNRKAKKSNPLTSLLPASLVWLGGPDKEDDGGAVNTATSVSRLCGPFPLTEQCIAQPCDNPVVEGGVAIFSQETLQHSAPTREGLVLTVAGELQVNGSCPACGREQPPSGFPSHEMGCVVWRAMNASSAEERQRLLPHVNFHNL